MVCLSNGHVSNPCILSVSLSNPVYIVSLSTFVLGFLHLRPKICDEVPIVSLSNGHVCILCPLFVSLSNLRHIISLSTFIYIK